ncbi:serine/threonine protein kinase [Lyngbya confervoides]|uniref:Serine/threonine protein kinase n=1 Tax=Lyngbya confervoides BDU141951 TaxID=1574623 RepID=A0ABD4T9H4_9CYAN|nr:serine/threonine-protein kinase [Lyngbya confervoides]MCM1985251.1 serine/threonine protein kinase [Lyngbya confervoides BDU141951]
MTLLDRFFNKKSVEGAGGSDLNELELRPGQLLANRYLLSDMIGQGAMGRVFRAEDKLLGVSVAVKAMAQNLLNQQMIAKFSREAQMGAFLGHQNVNIVRVLDYGVHENQIPFYVMEYIYGVTLEAEIARTPLTVPRCLKLMEQVCAGLHSAHQGVLIDNRLYSVIHRDLKPGNIFITHNPSLGELAKILDFGIAEFFHPAHKAEEHRPMGTLAYSSAEQLQGQRLEPTADIYSLGVTMFEALTGHLPIQPETNTVPAWIHAHSTQPPRLIRDVSPGLEIPEALEDIILRCLVKDPKKRPQRVQAVLDTLKAISQDLGTASPVYAATAPSHSDILDEIFGTVDSAASLSFSGSIATKTLADASAFIPKSSNSIPDSAVQGKPAPRQEAIPEWAITLSWPSDKPIAEIVFAKFMHLPDQEGVGLWAMLANAKIQQQFLPHRHIEFLVELDPHPMLAWVTVLYNDNGKMRSLPCFLDLAESQWQGMLTTLIQQGEYWFILYDAATPDRPIQVSSLKLSAAQRQQLQQSLTAASQRQHSRMPQMSKQKLRDRYQQLKASLPEKLASR